MAKSTVKKQSKSYFNGGLMKVIKNPAFWLFIISIALSLYANKNIAPTWTVEKMTIDALTDNSGQIFYKYKGKKKYITELIYLIKS